MYCHNSLGIVVVPPPPPEGSTTSSTNRVVVWCPRRSVAFRRMTDPDQDSGGYGRFVQTLPPIVKIPSSATLSVVGRPSAHLSTKTGGREPCTAFIEPSHSTVLFRVSTIALWIVSEERSAKFL